MHGDVSKKEEILQLAFKDLIVFGQLFSPQDYLATSSPPFHKEVGEYMLDRTIQQLALVLPRDHAKSTLAATSVLHKFLFATKERPEFVCWVGEAQDQAIDNTRWVQNHIEMNPAIQYYFGDLQGKKWTKTDFTLANGCRMIAKGTSQRLRGKKELSTRYTGIILDDFESEGNTKTAESRFAIKNWVTAAVYPAIDFDKGGFLWCNGTIVHWDSFLNNIVSSYRDAKKHDTSFAWKVITYKALEDGKPIWESRWSVEKLEKRKQFYIDSGTPSKFYQEYMNQARSPDDQIFTEDDINKGFYEGDARYDEEYGSWYIKLEDGSRPYINIFIGVDPASSIADRSDFSVVMVIGVTDEHDYYVIDYWRERVLPMECAEKVFSIAKQYEPIRRINIETITYQEMLRDYIQRRSKKEGVFLPGVEQGIKNYGNQKKKDRLFEGLQPMFRQGAVHLKKTQHEFIGELLDFPKGSHDDTIDAFWLACQYTRGRIVKQFKKGLERAKRSIAKRYNWMTGART